MKLLVIDIQKGITDSRLFNFDEFIDNTSRIIQAARDNQIEVIYFQHDDGPGTGFSIGDEEFEIAEQVTPREGEKIFIKNINSCFGNKDFTDYVKDENTLMIVGLQTNFCIDATVKSAFERGYKVIVPQGANSTLCAQPRVCSQAGGNPVYLRFSQPDNSESWDDAGNGI